MKLLLNAGTLQASGPCQVMRSFLAECIAFPQHEYHVFLSPAVQREIAKISFPDNFHFYLFEKHPLYSIFSRSLFSVLKRYHRLEQEIQPDCVFALFGPMWWKSKAPCVAGYASGQFIFGESPYFKQLSLLGKLKLKIHKIMFYVALKREAAYYITETEIARQRLAKWIKFPLDRLFVVSNTCSEIYKNFNLGDDVLPEKKTNEFRMFISALNQPHKNLDVLNGVIPLLRERCPNWKFTFVTTVSASYYEEHFDDNVKSSIINLGRIPAELCPQIYYECDALFLPTLLECFSASYPEAMFMKKPILTSNLVFATDICGKAALYFDPEVPADIADKIIMLVQYPVLQQKLIQAGQERIVFFPTSRQRAEKYLEIIAHILREDT